jgi:hypothetical protein
MKLTCWLWIQCTRWLSWQYRVRHTACTFDNNRTVVMTAVHTTWNLVAVSLDVASAAFVGPKVRLFGAGILQI